VNGVPLRRVNQRYVIATSTKVDLTGVDVAAIDDAFFARGKADSEKLSPARKAAQEKVDASLKSNIAKVAQLGDYLKNKFRLSNSDKPHLLKF
jgi:large subunit ribosomal protein L6e